MPRNPDTCQNQLVRLIAGPVIAACALLMLRKRRSARR